MSSYVYQSDTMIAHRLRGLGFRFTSLTPWATSKSERSQVLTIRVVWSEQRGGCIRCRKLPSVSPRRFGGRSWLMPNTTAQHNVDTIPMYPSRWVVACARMASVFSDVALHLEDKSPSSIRPIPLGWPSILGCPIHPVPMFCVTSVLQVCVKTQHGFSFPLSAL